MSLLRGKRLILRSLVITVHSNDALTQSPYCSWGMCMQAEVCAQLKHHHESVQVMTVHDCLLTLSFGKNPKQAMKQIQKHETSHLNLKRHAFLSFTRHKQVSVSHVILNQKITAMYQIKHSKNNSWTMLVFVVQF